VADRIEELGRAKEGVLVTYRVAFDDGSTSIIEPSKHAIAYAWQTHTHLGKLMDQAAFGKAARAAKTATSVAKAAAPPTRGVRMEVACCDADHEGEWDGEWEECEVVAEHGDTCDVRIVEDDELCRGVPRRLVRERCGSDAAAEAGRPSAELAREAGRPAAVDGSVGARVEAKAEAEAAPSGHQAEQPPSRAVGLPSTDSRPVPTACQPPEGAAQQPEGTPTTTMPTSEVKGAAGAEEACTMVGNKVLPPGWKRRTDFGKFKGYVGPQGRKVQTVPLAWAAHAEMQEEARTQAGLAARAEAGEAGEAAASAEAGEAGEAAARAEAGEAGETAAARAEAELVEPSTDLVREAARPSTSSSPPCEVRAPLEAGTGVAATSNPASQRASPLALPPPLSTLLTTDVAQTPRPRTPQTGAPAAPAAPAAPTMEKALPPPLSTLLTTDVAQTPRPRTPQAGAPAAPAAPTTEKEAAPEAVAARAKPVAAASQQEMAHQAFFEQMAHQRKQMAHQRERIAQQQEMAHQRQQAIAHSPALQQMKQQAQQQHLLLRQQQTRQQVQQQQMKVTPMQRVALQQMHAQQMMRLVAQHNEQAASPRTLAASPRHLALTMILTQENNSTRARTQTSSPPASLATRRSRR